MKECFKCKVSQPLSEFYKHKMMADGHLNKCKACAKKDVTAHRKENLNAHRDYDRARATTPRRRSEALSQQRRLRGRKWASTFVTGYNKRNDVFVPDYCESCCGNVGGVVGHHSDYSLPLTLLYLCRPCHRNWHVANGAGKHREGIPGIHM